MRKEEKMQEAEIHIDAFLDKEGKIKAMPSKRAVRKAVLAYLAAKFELGRNYTEKEINAICDQWHTFNDYFLLRRELVDAKFLQRERDGSRYWRAPDKEQ